MGVHIIIPESFRIVIGNILPPVAEWRNKAIGIYLRLRYNRIDSRYNITLLFWKTYLI